MTTPDSTATTPPTPRPRWYQFSLRTLLILMAVFGCGFAWLGIQVKRAIDQRRAVAALQATGAYVGYAEPHSVLSRWEWLRSQWGEEALLDVVSIDGNSTTVGDSEMSHLHGPTQLEWLSLNNTQVTDEGMSHLRGLTQLEWLSLKNTQVTDAGAAELQKSLPGLSVYR